MTPSATAQAPTMRLRPNGSLRTRLPIRSYWRTAAPGAKYRFGV